jgi:hypothetical protein
MTVTVEPMTALPTATVPLIEDAFTEEGDDADVELPPPPPQAASAAIIDAHRVSLNTPALPIFFNFLSFS